MSTRLERAQAVFTEMDDSMSAGIAGSPTMSVRDFPTFATVELGEAPSSRILVAVLDDGGVTLDKGRLTRCETHLDLVLAGLDSARKSDLSAIDFAVAALAVVETRCPTFAWRLEFFGVGGGGENGMRLVRDGGAPLIVFAQARDGVTIRVGAGEPFAGVMDSHYCVAQETVQRIGDEAAAAVAKIIGGAGGISR